MSNNKKCYLGALVKYDCLGSGAYSDVYLCDFYESLFVYKEYKKKEYVNFIQQRLEKISQFYNDKNFVFPYKFIYKHPNDKNFLGYIIDYLYKYKRLCDINDLKYEDKIKLLKKARNLLDIFHNEYNFIHSDINPLNILYNKEYDILKLIDFDTYIDLNDKEKVLCKYYNQYAQFYGNSVGIDKDLDIFLFNLTTFSLLTNVDYDSLLKVDMKDKIKAFESETIRNIFNGYKNLECKKSLKKEYVIDYL